MLNENIKTLRKNKGFTQEELASRLHVTRQTISKWEKGLSVPDAETLSRMAEVFDVSVAELLGVEQIEHQQMDAVVEQLCRINEQLAIRNRRSKRIWKTVIIIAIILIAVPATLTVAGVAAFMVNAPTVSESGPHIAGTAEWKGELNGQTYNYAIEYNDKFKIITYSGPADGPEETTLRDMGHPDFSSYSDANEMAEDLEAYYDENGGDLEVEIRQLAPEIYEDEFRK